MTKELHVVLGANGVTGRAVVEELNARNLPYRTVGRQPKTDDHYVQADLLNPDDTARAVNDATHVYVCVGLPYDTNTWERDWIPLMTNVLDAVKDKRPKLIFLDNVYLYGPLDVPFDEQHKRRPKARKGKVRLAVTELVETTCEEHDIPYVIGRAPDFFGPGATGSVVYASFLERMLTGKDPLFLGRIDQLHSFAYTTDIGRALVVLGTSDKATGKTYHLPLSGKRTIAELADLMNKELNTNFSVKATGPFMHALIGLFVPIVKTMKEMRYQFDHPYDMSDALFRKDFPNFQSTPIETAIQTTVQSFQQ